MINTCIKTFLKNAGKNTMNVGPHRPEMLNLVFSKQKGCQAIYCKTGYHNNELLQEIANDWGKHLEMDITFDDLKT